MAGDGRLGTWTRGLLALVLVASLAPVAPVVAAPRADRAAAQAGPIDAQAATFIGGADQAPRYALNDHTPIAVHFTASGLKPSTTYYLKIRFTVSPDAPSGSSNRGWTWNPTTGAWAQERGPWTACPTVTTDASGSITGGGGTGNDPGWTYAAFGDESTSGAFYTMISLSETGQASTYNSITNAPITILDAATQGTRVHNGAATGAQVRKKALLTQDTSSGVVYGQSRTETNTVDDDVNGVVDDEDYGPAGTSGDFWLAGPAGTPIKVVFAPSTTWAPSVGFVTGPADVDLAIGAAETVAPSAPSLTATSAVGGTIHLSWSASADNVGVAGYHVYRWDPSLAGSQYSPAHVRIATVTGATAYDDAAVVEGTVYRYEVRAFDAATNVSARSNTAEAVSDATGPNAIGGLTVSAAGTSTVNLAWPAPSDALAGKAAAYMLRYTESNDPDPATFASWTQVAAAVPGAAGTTDTATVSGLLKGHTYAFAMRSKDAAGNWSLISNVVTATPAGLRRVGREFGDTRFQTAIATSRSVFATGSCDTVVLATGWEFADALAAAGLAGSYDAPLLLANATLTTELRDEIDRVGADHVIICGSNLAVPDAVETSLTANGKTVERLQGASRYGTAAAIAKRIRDRGGSTKAFFARGDSFPDALACSPLAYTQKMPILLVRQDSVPESTTIAIGELGIDSGVIAGNELAIFSGTADTLDTLISGELVRKGGAGRYATAAAIAAYGTEQGWGDFGYVGVALGTNFPDALGGGVAAGKRNGVLLITRPDSIPTEVEGAISTNRLQVDDAVLYGKNTVLPDAILNGIKNLLK